MSSNSNSNYPWLPLEIYSKIFDELPIDDESAVILARATQANHLFQGAIKDLEIWRLLYETRYTHHDVKGEQDRLREYGENWRLRYTARRRMDASAMGSLRSIVRATNEGVLSDMAKNIVQLGSDVWDALKLEASLPSPINFQSDEDLKLVTQGRPLSTLTKSYWTQELMGMIARRTAIERWIAMRKREVNCALALEEGLSLLSAFFDVHPDDVSSICSNIFFRSSLIFVGDV